MKRDGKGKPTGKLPFELSSRMKLVRKQRSDVRYDSENLTYPFGLGLVYYFIFLLDQVLLKTYRISV